MRNSGEKKRKGFNYIVLAVFVIALIILCFFQQCALDLYILAFGFAVAAVATVALLLQDRKNKDRPQK